MRINWRYFEENSSSFEALVEFLEGSIGIKTFKKDCWPQECKHEIDKMQRLGVCRARARGRKYFRDRQWVFI